MRKYIGKLILKFIGRKVFNRMVHGVILDAYEYKIISSSQMHAILGEWNRQCFPECNHRGFTQRKKSGS